MLLNLFPHAKAQKDEQRRAEFYRALLQYAARVGGELFGPVPKGCRREFFCLDEHTWVWHEEWKDEQGKNRVLTTRYDVRPNGVVKSQGDSVYQALTEQEARNFYAAVHLYQQKIDTDLYRMTHHAA